MVELADAKNCLLGCKFCSGNPAMGFDTWILGVKFPLVHYSAFGANQPRVP